MKGVWRYLITLLGTLLLSASVLTALAFWATTPAYFSLTLAAGAADQQGRIDAFAQDAAGMHRLSPQTLAPFTADAAKAHRAALAKWWGSLFSDPEADRTLPMYLAWDAERALVEAVMADEGFRAAYDSGQWRAVARDEVAWALDQAVCAAVLPLRRSVADLALALLPLDAAVRWRGWLPVLALALAAGALTLLHAMRRWGEGLAAAGGTLLLCLLPPLALGLPGMLAQLSQTAHAQGCAALGWLLWPLGLTAAALMAGGIIIMAKRKADA